MNFNLFSANCLGNPENSYYPHERLVTDEVSLIEAVSRDYVGALYFGNWRSSKNFICSNVVIMDVDNTHSDNLNDWVTPEDLLNDFPDVRFIVHYSRHHMKEKDGRSPRPRFHVLYPCALIKNAEQYKAMKSKLAQIVPYFDPKSLDAGHCFFGTENPKVQFFDGGRSITEFLVEYIMTHPQSDTHKQRPAVTPLPAVNCDQSVHQKDVIPQGTRNNTMLKIAEKVLKHYGPTDDAYREFLSEAQKCEPLLDDEELQTIWENARNFYEETIRTSEGYIPPDEFNVPPASETTSPSLAPDDFDFTDIGQAKILAREYADRLRYSNATDFICFNRSHWEESNILAYGIAQELTDRQLDDAKAFLDYATDALKKCNALNIVLQHGIKKAGNYLNTPAQQDALEQYKHALEYEKFVKERRKSSNINAVLECVKSYVLIKPEQLDADAFLLNTPRGTVDLRTGIIRPHDPNDLITKMTEVSPDDENMQMWLDALDVFFCGDEELIRYVQEIAGLAAIGKVLVEGLVIAYGRGRNGKSTFWNTIARVLGNNSYSGKISAGALTLGYRHNVKAELAETRSKRLLIASELEEDMRLNTAVVKNLCSTDRIQAEKKFKAPFSFTPSHTLVLYTNHLPEVGTTDEGTWRRLILVPFNATIEGERDVKNYSDHLVKNAGGAVLKWIIEGAQRIITKHYKLDTPQIVSDAINDYRANNDWFAAFLRECCEVDPNASVQSGALYCAYCDYCKCNYEHVRNTKVFYGTLERAGFSRKKGANCITINGLKLRVPPSVGTTAQLAQ